MYAEGAMRRYGTRPAVSPTSHIASSPSLSPESSVVKFSVAGRSGAYVLAAANLPVTGTVVLDVPYASGNQCGEAVFPGPISICTCTAAAGLVKCK